MLGRPADDGACAMDQLAPEIVIHGSATGLHNEATFPGASAAHNGSAGRAGPPSFHGGPALRGGAPHAGGTPHFAVSGPHGGGAPHFAMGSPHGRARAPAPMTEAQAATTAEVPDIFCSKLDTPRYSPRGASGRRTWTANPCGM